MLLKLDLKPYSGHQVILEKGVGRSNIGRIGSNRVYLKALQQNHEANQGEDV